MRDSVGISYTLEFHLNMEIAISSEHLSKGLCKYAKCSDQMIKRIEGTGSTYRGADNPKWTQVKKSRETNRTTT